MDNIIFSNNKPENSQLNKLFELIGWKRDVSKWPKVLNSSSFIVCAYNKGDLVGFGRILEDGVMCMLYDIVVDPEYQGRGIGTEIMNRLIEEIKHKDYASIGLFAWDKNPDNITFYEKFGFKRVNGGMELTKHMKPE